MIKHYAHSSLLSLLQGIDPGAPASDLYEKCRSCNCQCDNHDDSCLHVIVCLVKDVSDLFLISVAKVRYGCELNVRIEENEARTNTDLIIILTYCITYIIETS